MKLEYFMLNEYVIIAIQDLLSEGEVSAKKYHTDRGLVVGAEPEGRGVYKRPRFANILCTTEHKK